MTTENAGETLLSQTSADRLKLLHFCKLLGLDPDKTTELQVNVTATGRATVAWKGRWDTDAETIAAIIDSLE